MSMVLEILHAEDIFHLELPVYTNGISCGMPDPQYESIAGKMDMNKNLIQNPLTTFYARVSGQSMIDDGISDGDLLVIDRSLEPEDGKIAVCFVDGEFTCKRIKLKKDGIWLMPANVDYRPIHISEESNFQIWGIVTHVIKSF